MKKRTPIYTKTERKGVILAGHKLYTDNNLPVFWKEVNRDPHFVRMFQGYGIQFDVYKGYIKDKQGWVIIHEDKKNYIMSHMEAWDTHGFDKTLDVVDGKQRFLQEKYMEKFATIDEVKQYMDKNPPQKRSKQLPLVRF